MFQQLAWMLRPAMFVEVGGGCTDRVALYSRTNLAKFADLRTRIETGQVTLMLVPADGSKPMWLARI